jgi:hypothetical protein
MSVFSPVHYGSTTSPAGSYQPLHRPFTFETLRTGALSASNIVSQRHCQSAAALTSVAVCPPAAIAVQPRPEPHLHVPAARVAPTAPRPGSERSETGVRLVLSFVVLAEITGPLVFRFVVLQSHSPASECVSPLSTKTKPASSTTPAPNEPHRAARPRSPSTRSQLPCAQPDDQILNFTAVSHICVHLRRRLAPAGSSSPLFRTGVSIFAAVRHGGFCDVAGQIDIRPQCQV